MPPKKRFEDTWRGKVQRRKEENARKKAEKEKAKLEKKELAAQGLCKGPEGEIGTFAEIGRKYGTSAWTEASREVQEVRKETGRTGGAATWDNLTEEEQQNCVNRGREWWSNLCGEDAEEFREERRRAWQLSSSNVQESIRSNLEVFNVIRHEEAEDRYEEDGDIVFKPDVSVLNCSGEDCDMKCANDVRIFSFSGISDVTMMKWLVNHKLMPTNCQFSGCGSKDCYPVKLVDDVGLKCPKCGGRSKGGKRGIFAKAKLGFVKMIFVIYCIATGCSYAYATRHVEMSLGMNSVHSFT